MLRRIRRKEKAERKEAVRLFQKILVASLKGGIGKSTVSLGVAASLAARGKRVLLVDCDAGNRCLDLMMGLEDRILYDLGDVISGRCSPADAVIPHPEGENLFFCAAPNRLPDPFSGEDACRALTELAGEVQADYVFCDTAGSGPLMQAIASGFADGALIIATQQPASVRSAERTALLVEELGGIPCRLVISLFEETAAAEGQRAGLIEIIDQTHLQTVGVVPKDRTLFLAQEKGKLPQKNTRAGQAFANIAGRIDGEDIRLFAGIRKIRTKRVL